MKKIILLIFLLQTIDTVSQNNYDCPEIKITMAFGYSIQYDCLGILHLNGFDSNGVIKANYYPSILIERRKRKRVIKYLKNFDFFRNSVSQKNDSIDLYKPANMVRARVYSFKVSGLENSYNIIDRNYMKKDTLSKRLSKLLGLVRSCIPLDTNSSPATADE
ncbi:MAG: hypothetical protein N4A45_05435 [Flavobacteriales bacterium]|jgi:hypothetical protein|nr:hypothetical protein [Flavobacteriales bacterium]